MLTKSLPKICQRLANFWLTVGKLLANFWQTFGQLLVNFWSTFGKLLATFGQLLVSFRPTLGKLLEKRPGPKTNLSFHDFPFNVPGHPGCPRDVPGRPETFQGRPGAITEAVHTRDALLPAVFLVL